MPCPVQFTPIHFTPIHFTPIHFTAGGALAVRLPCPFHFTPCGGYSVHSVTQRRRFELEEQRKVREPKSDGGGMKRREERCEMIDAREEIVGPDKGGERG
jgi:hypothetical protein